MRPNLILLLIVIFSAFLRFYNLADNPPSLNWDEASLGYNAWTLLNYGTDEYGNDWPFSIRSFNDYKPPLYSYLTMLPVAIFGLTEFSTRFISALLGTLTTVVVYFLTFEFFGFVIPAKAGIHGRVNNKTTIDSRLRGNDKYIALLAATLFAISPWSLQFSRGAFEGNIAVFFTALGALFLLKWLNNHNSTIQKFSHLTIAAFSFTFALYSYHAARLVIPLIAFLILIRYSKYILRHWQQVVPTIIISTLLLIPLLVITFRGSTGARVGAVSIFNPKYVEQYIKDRETQEKLAGNYLFSLIYDDRVHYLRLILEGYLDHYDIRHMFIQGDIVDRHHAPNMGLLYLVELPFILIGLFNLATKKFNGKFLFWSWWLLAPLPAALASGTPHAIRSILWLPLPQIATAVGVITVVSYFLKFVYLRNFKFVVYCILCISIFCNFIYYQLQYHLHQPVENAREWQYSYKQLVEYLQPLYPQFDEVIMTTSYDQPYIFFLFYEQYPLELGVNPGDFNRHYKNITFEAVDIFKLRDQYKSNPQRTMLIIGAGDEIPPGEPIELTNIRFPNGEVSFRIVKFTKEK